MYKVANIYPLPINIGNINQNYLTGGGETESYDFAIGLAKSGNIVTHMVGMYRSENSTDTVVNNNLKVKQYKLNFSQNFALAFSIQMFFDLLLGDFDIIHSHQIPIAFSLLGGIAARLSGKKFIITFCGKLPRTKLEKILYTLNSLLAHRIVVQNSYVTEVVGRPYNIKKLYTIPYYINSHTPTNQQVARITRKYNLSGKKVILTLCRLIPAKGVDIIIEALTRINDKENIVLVIAGKGPEEQALRNLVEKFGLEKKVIFTKFVEPDDIFALYSCADVFVLASTYRYKNGQSIEGMCETFALVLGEAMSCGVPVIASAVGGIPHWIKHNYNGLLFTERDVNALSRLIKRLLDDKVLVNRLITNSKSEITKKYTREVVVQQFEMLYKKVIN